MGNFLTRIEQTKGYKAVIFVLKALFENYLETGTREKPSKFDVGPINTMISQNFYDGLRLRVSGQTTANLISLSKATMPTGSGIRKTTTTPW